MLLYLAKLRRLRAGRCGPGLVEAMADRSEDNDGTKIAQEQLGSHKLEGTFTRLQALIWPASDVALQG